LFSSPAIGSFASPRFQAKGHRNKRFTLSDDDTDDADAADHCDVDELTDANSSAGIAGSWQSKSNSFSLENSRQDSDAHSPYYGADCDDGVDLDGLSSSNRLPHVQQQLLLRFSCADSLDRTNLASFFVALQFVGETLCFTNKFRNKF
jgi:hypothetical protein